MLLPATSHSYDTNWGGFATQITRTQSSASSTNTAEAVRAAERAARVADFVDHEEERSSAVVTELDLNHRRRGEQVPLWFDNSWDVKSPTSLCHKLSAHFAEPGTLRTGIGFCGLHTTFLVLMYGLIAWPAAQAIAEGPELAVK